MHTTDEPEEIGHDQLFKQLLTTFFLEFLDLFLPDVVAYIDGGVIEFLDKETFTDIAEAEVHLVDVIAKVKYRGEDTCFLIHVEPQASLKPNFSRRMFDYYALLHRKFKLDVYPIALHSWDTPLREEPYVYERSFPDRQVLRFEFASIQLNRLDWRAFVNRQNPVAAALMAKMRIAPADRPRVKLECFRLLATLKLDPARSRQISGFIRRYLQLTAEEFAVYKREVEMLPQPAQEEIMASSR